MLRDLYYLGLVRVRYLVVVSMAIVVCSGCGGYRLRGVVIEGQTSAVMLVDENDARLKQVGVEAAKIELTLDPSSMRPKRLGDGLTDARGRFDLPIDQFGAGMLEYELAILCRAKGYRPLWQNIELPRRGRYLIIVMQPGRDRVPAGSRDIVDETIRIGEQLMNQ